MLGNKDTKNALRSQKVYANGVQVGTNESSEDIPMSHGCFGATYDGTSIGSIMISKEDRDPFVNITNINSTEVSLHTHENGTLDQWIQLLKGTLEHLEELNNAN